MLCEEAVEIIVRADEPVRVGRRCRGRAGAGRRALTTIRITAGVGVRFVVRSGIDGRAAARGLLGLVHHEPEKSASRTKSEQQKDSDSAQNQWQLTGLLRGWS